MRCRGCGAEVVWAMAPDGKGMPVDAAPSEHGTLELYTGASGGLCVRLGSGGPRFLSHLAVCPRVEVWKR